MIPENVLNAIHEQLRPLVLELARYNSLYDSIQMEFDVGSVRFDFKDKKDEDNN